MKQSQELFPGLRARPHTSQHAAGCCSAANLLHASHDHAQVGRFHDDSDTSRLENLRYSQSNLLGQSLLDLKSAGEHLGQASQFGEAEDAAIRDVADMHLPHMIRSIPQGLYARSHTFPVKGTM